MNQQNLIFVVFATALFPVVLAAQVVPVTNNRFQVPAPVIHNQPNMPKGWELESGKPANVRAWDAPRSSAISIGKGTVLTQTVAIPEITPKLLGESKKWKLLLAADVIGIDGNRSGKSEITLAIRDSESKELLGKQSFPIRQRAPRSSLVKPSAAASSFKPGSGRVEHAFDADRNTIWHSNYGQTTAKYPHFLTLDFGETKQLSGLTYVPRSNGGNGTLKTAAVEVTSDGVGWQRVAEGEFKYSKRGEPQFIELNKPVRCRSVRLVCLSSVNGADFASCAELIPQVKGGFKGLQVGQEAKTAPEKTAPIARCFLPLEFAAGRIPKTVDIGLSVQANRFVVVNAVHLMTVPQFATKKMLGKPNGHLGPDLLGAGSYGFQAMMVHGLPVLPMIKVHEGSPASQANLLKTDLIVGINNQFLPAGNVAPGFEWFESSHEALLGRAAMKAFEVGGKGKVILNVLRGKRVAEVPLRLGLPSEIGKANFLTNPKTLELLNSDLIATVVATQKENGSWSGGPIQTSLGGLALLSTGDKRHAERVHAAANWLMSRHAEPGAGWYWHPSFAGIFLSEYYLATGDKRVLPVIRRMLRMMGSVFHTSKWGTRTFGHGPKGLPYGNKSLVAVMVHVLVFEELAGRCGLESEIFETLTPYLESAWSNPDEGGHGAMGYNASYKDQAEFWSRTGLFGLALKMRGERTDIQRPMAEIMRKRHPWFRNSHAYGEPGAVLGFIGLSQMQPRYFEEVFQKYRWWFALAWEPGKGLHFTIPHMGAPYMEGPDLINNGYALVSNIHKGKLQILGGRKRNWLDVSKLEPPISDVMILQVAQDRIAMRCKIPGPTIYYTLDGSDPNRRSKKYSQPFSVKPGVVVRAIAIDQSNQSKISTRAFGYEKSDWKVVAANGDRDPDAAARRAEFAFDGDQSIGWVPDQGEGAEGFPYHVVVDMGKTQSVNRAGIRYTFNNGAAANVSVFGASKADGEFNEIGAKTTAKFETDSIIELDGSKVRFLKFSFNAPLQKESKLLMVGEIDVR